MPTTDFHQTRLGVPSIAGRLLKVIETCVYMIYDMRRGHIAGNIDVRNQTLMGYNIHDKKTYKLICNV